MKPGFGSVALNCLPHYLGLALSLNPHIHVHACVPACIIDTGADQADTEAFGENITIDSMDDSVVAIL